MAHNPSNLEVVRRRNGEGHPVFDLEATTSPRPDLHDLLNRPAVPFALAPVATTSPGLQNPQTPVAGSRTPTSSPTTTRSRRTGRSSVSYRHRNSPSTVPTSILPSSPPTKKVVQVEQPTERRSSSASIRATVGSDTGSSSEVNRNVKEKELVEHVWHVGQQFSSSESSVARKCKRRTKKNYHVVVNQAPPDTALPPASVQLQPHRINWLQLVNTLLNFAVLVICIGILLKLKH